MGLLAVKITEADDPCARPFAPFCYNILTFHSQESTTISVVSALAAKWRMAKFSINQSIQLKKTFLNYPVAHPAPTQACRLPHPLSHKGEEEVLDVKDLPDEHVEAGKGFLGGDVHLARPDKHQRREAKVRHNRQRLRGCLCVCVCVCA